MAGLQSWEKTCSWCYGGGCPELQLCLSLQFLLHIFLPLFWGLPQWLSRKEPSCQQRKCSRIRRYNPWVGKIPWRRKWQTAPISCLEKSHGQRNMGAIVQVWSGPGHKRVRNDLATKQQTTTSGNRIFFF